MNEANSALDRRTKTVLGIDDSGEMQMILQATICAVGYNYVGARTGADAMARISGPQRFDVILLDVQLPDTDGFQLCTKIRTQANARKVPVIFLTVRNTVADVKNCTAAGGDAFIVKPFNAKTLIRYLDHWSTREAGAAGVPDKATATATGR